MARVPNTGRSYLAVTPSDTAKLSKGVADGFWVGTAGDLVITGDDNQDVTIPSAQGHVPYASLYVKATGTTASGIVAIYGGA